MRRHFTVQQALEEIFSEAQEKQEDEDVSEEEDGEKNTTQKMMHLQIMKKRKSLKLT